jgi:hypothetical protein
MPRLRLMRQITFSNAFGSRFIPRLGITTFFSRYSSAPASSSLYRFFSERLLNTTTGISAVE